jgi:hypothetical protein
MTCWAVIDSDATDVTNSGMVVVIDSNLTVAIDIFDSDRMAEVNLDVRVAADLDGVAVIRSDSMAEINSEVPVEAVIDSDRKATMDSGVTAVTDSDVKMKGD